MSQHHASVSQGCICSDNFTCCRTEIQIADQTFYLTKSQYTDTGPTSPSTDPITPGAWQGNHWSANFQVTCMTRPRKILTSQARIKPRIFHSQGRRLNPLLGAAWPTVYFLQGRLGMAANFTRAYRFVCPAIVANISGVNSQ